MKRLFTILFRIFFHYHFFIALCIMVVVIVVLTLQIQDRATFANTELYKDVIDRWGAPIHQPVPSVRYIPTGTVFTELYKLPFSHQHITIKALMNYRKRGLVYFSGFDFRFEGNYSIVNDEESSIDVVFVFPINLERNKILLSDLGFFVDDVPEAISLSETGDKLIWTGRLSKEESITFMITYKGRGLDEFTYFLDPGLPVRDFHLTAEITGGNNYDYAEGVVPATATDIVSKEKVILTWDYTSLESGVPLGLVLPSEKSFDTIITTMTMRSWATFILFFSGIIAIFLFSKKKLHLYTACFIASCYAFFFILLAYLTAYMPFYLAYAISLITISLMLFLYMMFTLSLEGGLIATGLFIIYQFIPTLAVIMEGHTGLIYTLEILLGLCILMFILSRKNIQSVLTDFYRHILKEETA
jgi:hypothetical protein